MIKLGKTQTLEVEGIVSIGAYLDAETGDRNDNILLPNNQFKKADIEVGDKVEVFIYRDSDDRLVASIDKPFVEVGQLARLKVVSKSKIGAFLDWGLPKDLLLPFKEQVYDIEEEKSYLVAVYVDNTDRICATTYVNKYLQTDSEFKMNDEISGTVYDIKRDKGYFIAVDNKYKALLRKSESRQTLKIGDVINARISWISDDGKLELSQRKKAYLQLDDDAEMILNKLKKGSGSLPVNDKSNPEYINYHLNISKKAFKRAIGKLLKENLIIQTAEGIMLKKK